jgi:hypothetical protein
MKKNASDCIDGVRDVGANPSIAKVTGRSFCRKL